MAVSDKLKATQIKANIIADDKVGMMDIDTEVDDGVAVLTGEVETEEQKRIAEELAYEVDGVEEVHNEIRVVPREDSSPMQGDDAHFGYGLAEGNVGETAFAISGDYTTLGPGLPTSEQFPGEYTDEQIVEEVGDRLASQQEVDVSSVQFTSNNQIVSLTGKIGTPDDLNRLQDIVLNCRGVMGVDSHVEVASGEIGTPTEE